MLALLVLTVLSLAVAAIMSVVAWRLAHEEERRSDARVAALAAEIHGSGMFAAPPSRTPASLVGALMIGVIVVGGATALAVVLGGAPRGGAAAAPVAAPAPQAKHEPPAAAPLELVALGHERTGDELVVRGIVRDPNRTNATGRITAVVFVFNHEGGFAASGRAPIAATTAGSGVESSFVVTVGGVSDVGRYRVSFRRDDEVVAHVDRRDHVAGAQLP